MVATIRRSIEISRKQTRRLKLRSLGHLFGHDRWSAKEKQHINDLFSAQGVELSPALDQVEADDWVHLNLAAAPAPAPKVTATPSTDFFDYLNGLQLDTEKEVELHFVSPLFHQLGYDDEQEAAGFPFDLYLGSEGARRREADLLYFADAAHDVREGHPLVLVECKAPTEPRDAGLGQVQAYAYWLKPAYYVVSNGDALQVWLYQGGPVHDKKLLDANRHQLVHTFEKLFELLQPQSATAAREHLLAKFASMGPDEAAIAGVGMTDHMSEPTK
ncbi:MAG: type I restriction enzyme HsdR N-terminal domain-containing protein [Acidimicrobiales bacterium]